MKKGDGSFWAGLLIGKMLSGKNDDSSRYASSKHDFSFFEMILVLLGIGVILIVIGVAIFIYTRFGIKGIIIAAVLVFIVIPVIDNILKKRKEYTLNTAAEAWKLFNHGSYTLALEKAEQVAKKNSDAAYLAGVLYLNGEGCDVNLEKAFKYFKMGKNKNMEAKTNYALMLLNGNGCQQNIGLGRKELLTAANIGKNTIAIMRVGEFQITGDFGFKKNVEKGMKNLRIAVDEGYPLAMYLVGAMQYNGIDGVPENKEKGLELIKKASEQGIQAAVEFINNLNKV